MGTVPAVGHADDVSYLDRLEEGGLPVGGTGSQILLTSGRFICAQLKRGHSIEDLMPTSGHPEQAARRHEQLRAAQQELCPDTMGHAATGPIS